MPLFKCGNDKAYTETFNSKSNTDEGYGGDPAIDTWVNYFTGYYTLAKKGKVKSVTFGSEQLYIGGSGQSKMWFGPSNFSAHPCSLYGSNDNSTWTLIQSGIIMGTTTPITTSSKYKYLKVYATGPNYNKWVDGAGFYWACAIPTFTVNYRG